MSRVWGSWDGLKEQKNKIKVRNALEETVNKTDETGNSPKEK